MDPKRVVAKGYDRIGKRYQQWSQTVRPGEREKYTRLLLQALPAGAELLELGCGSGLTTKQLAETFRVTGVDISAQQIELARKAVPGTRFIQADMTAIDFPPGSFDAVAAFYSLTHVPREQHAGLFESIARWLRRDGFLLASLGAGSVEGDIEDDWLGAPMYFSHFDAAENQALLKSAGLEIEHSQIETADEDGKPASFLWVLARKREGDAADDSS